MKKSDLIKEIGLKILDKIQDRKVLHKENTNEFKNNYFGDNSEGIIESKAKLEEARDIYWLVEDAFNEYYRKFLKED